MFEYQLMERARADRQRIVLPESQDDRILEAAAILLRRGVADLTLLGDETKVRARASALGLDLDEASIVSPFDADLVEQFAAAYAEARAHKGMTVERAREIVTDISYFGTLMVHLGLADGMVSGAVNTTAHTIRPALEFVKTRPGVSTVSSVFLMCLADRVLVYGDCAVIPEPTTEQLADIAISSAETAQQFGIEPRVAMLSYSTGTSGSGADVEKVRAATSLVAERSPDLLLEGPIQYDAAVDPEVARTKLPDSPVAGRATVFIFPDLNTGNNTYKAVQRSANAIAIGPVLQGLRKPVNDLSRGALISDIVNTVAITAVQAQAIKQAERLTTRDRRESGMIQTPVLVLNAGSSSLKYQLVVPETAEVQAKGIIERIGETGSSIADHDAAMRTMEDQLAAAGVDLDTLGLRAVGHRVVHGGPNFSDPTIIDDDVLDEIKDLIPLAPLHNPGAVSGIEAARAEFDIPHVAIFDTAFFSTLP